MQVKLFDTKQYFSGFTVSFFLSLARGFIIMLRICMRKKILCAKMNNDNVQQRDRESERAIEKRNAKRKKK